MQFRFAGVTAQAVGHGKMKMTEFHVLYTEAGAPD